MSNFPEHDHVFGKRATEIRHKHTVIRRLERKNILNNKGVALQYIIIVVVTL